MDGLITSRNGSGALSYNYGGFFYMNNKKSVKKDPLHNQLWHACAGPSVYVPQDGDLVFYFPQGHLEQIAAFVEQDGKMDMPFFDLPSKILCKVECIELEAEAHTDEVYAQIALHPIMKPNKHCLMEENNCHFRPFRTIACFSKTLTQSDTSTHGGFSIPKRHADECFPPMDMTLEAPSQDIVARDLHGVKWHFRHTYRGQPRRHLLTSGWSVFVNSKRLIAGDTCIFIRGQNGELRIGVRRAMKQPNRIASIISGHSMQVGILGTIAHALDLGSIFNVFYHPWTNPNEFIVSVDQYLKSTRVDYLIGMRIKMERDVGDFARRRYEGTIIGKEAIDGIKWPYSEWRCLKVQWDSILNTSMQLERICPWSIEPLELTKRKGISILPLPTKANVLDTSSNLWGSAKNDISEDLIKFAHLGDEGNLQAQRYNEAGPSRYAPGPKPLTYENNGHFFMQNPFYKPLPTSMAFPNENISTSSPIPPTPIITSQGFSNSILAIRDPLVSNVNPSEFTPNEKDGTPFNQHGSYDKYKLFGVSLLGGHPKLSSSQGLQVTIFKQIIPTSTSIPVMSHASINAAIPVPKPSKNLSGDNSQKPWKKCFSNHRTCTKVIMYGSAIGRSIDLARFSGYEELISELDRMFNFQGSLVDGRSRWHVVCINDDGNKMLLRGFSWQYFQMIVKKMMVCPKENHGKRKFDIY